MIAPHRGVPGVSSFLPYAAASGMAIPRIFLQPDAYNRY